MVEGTRLAFEGFGPHAVEWFSGLEDDNSKAYFEANRSTYFDEVREPFELLLEDLCDSFGGDVKVFRPYRDVRFSADKSPYKTACYGIVHSTGGSSALYAAVSARELYAGTGYWRMARDQLERFYAAVLDDAIGPVLELAVDEIGRAGLELGEPSLKTAPRGMSRDHPRVALLRYKSLVAGRRLEPGPEFESRDALSFVATTWRSAAPLTDWLASHVGPSTLPPDPGRRGGRR